jgi:hypothetical protein
VDAGSPVVSDAQDFGQQAGLFGQCAGHKLEFVLGLLLEGGQGMGFQPGAQPLHRSGRILQCCGQSLAGLFRRLPTAGIGPTGVRLQGQLDSVSEVHPDPV